MVYFKFEFGLGSGKKASKKAAPKCITLGWDFVNDEVMRLKTAGRFKTASNYLTAARSWTKFMEKSDWRFSEMEVVVVERYQRWLSERGVCLNTISAYMRALRVMYHRAMEAGKQEPSVGLECQKGIGSNPFVKVFTGRAKTAKRSISEKEILQLHNLQLPKYSSLSLARDIFLFGFYAMGMPFVDIAYLRKSNLREGFILYARHKTGQPIRVAILPPMRELMQRYNRPDSEYLFPILSEGCADTLHRQYLRHLRQYNYSLHRLSEMMEVSRPLSSYVVRHTWASIAYQHHVDISLIGKALGHTKTSTTLLYIRSLFDPDLADANQGLMEDIGL